MRRVDRADERDLQFGTKVVSEDWRKLTLLAPKQDGSTTDVVLLRPLTWLNEQLSGRSFLPERTSRLAATVVCNRCDHVDFNMSDCQAHLAVVEPVAAARFA